MTSNDLRDTLDALALTQVGAARFLNVNPRTMRDWLADKYPIPAPVAMLLGIMLAERARITLHRARKLGGLDPL